MTKQSTLHIFIDSNEHPFERRINFADVAWSEAERIARVGYWHGNRLYPPTAIRYIEVMEDKV